MMLTKRALLACIAVLAMTFAAGCGSDDSSSGGSSDGAAKKDLTIAFTTITLADQSFVRLNRSAEAEAKKLGVKLILQNPNGDPVAQSNAVDTFVQRGVDAIIFDAIDPNGILPSVKAAQAQGIPGVAVDEVLSNVAFINASAGIDNFEVGRQLGEVLVKQVGDKEAHVGIVQTLDSPIENTRVDGFKAAIQSHDNIKLVGRADAKYNLDKAANGAENLITSDPKLNWFYATGGIYGEGIVSAIKSQGKQGQIKMVGWDLTKALVQPLKDGTYVQAAQQDFEQMGAVAVDTAVKLAEKKAVPRFNTVPAHMVTPANLDQYIDQVN